MSNATFFVGLFVVFIVLLYVVGAASGTSILQDGGITPVNFGSSYGGVQPQPQPQQSYAPQNFGQQQSVLRGPCQEGFLWYNAGTLTAICRGGQWVAP